MLSYPIVVQISSVFPSFLPHRVSCSPSKWSSSCRSNSYQFEKSFHSTKPKSLAAYSKTLKQNLLSLFNSRTTFHILSLHAVFFMFSPHKNHYNLFSVLFRISHTPTVRHILRGQINLYPSSKVLTVPKVLELTGVSERVRTKTFSLLTSPEFAIWRNA